MKKLNLTATHYKLLITMEWMNAHHLYPTANGIYKIVHGVYDQDTVNLTMCPTFEVLISYSSKRISNYVLVLYRYGYLGKVYDEKTHELYYEITLKGKEAISEHYGDDIPSFKKKKKTFVPQIVKINKR